MTTPVPTTRDSLVNYHSNTEYCTAANLLPTSPAMAPSIPNKHVQVAQYLKLIKHSNVSVATSERLPSFKTTLCMLRQYCRTSCMRECADSLALEPLYADKLVTSDTLTPPAYSLARGGQAWPPLLLSARAELLTLHLLHRELQRLHPHPQPRLLWSPDLSPSHAEQC